MSDYNRLFHAFALLVRQVTSRFDYFASYPSRVVAQNGDGSLELKPDDERFGPGLARVPMRLGLPGCNVTVKPGSRVLLGFEGGDPARPVAELWDIANLDTLTLTAATKITVHAPAVELSEGGLPVARQGDMVACGGATPTPCLIQLPSGPNTGAPQPATITFLPLPLYGLITSGNAAVRS